MACCWTKARPAALFSSGRPVRREQHPLDVAIDYSDAFSEGDAGDGRAGVLADAW